MKYKAFILFSCIFIIQLHFKSNLNASELKLNTTFQIEILNKIPISCDVYIYNDKDFYKYKINHDKTLSVSINEGKYLIDIKCIGYRQDFRYGKIHTSNNNANENIKFKLFEMNDTYLEYNSKLNDSTNYSLEMHQRIIDLSKTNYDFDFYYSPASLKLNKIYNTYLINNLNTWNHIYVKRYLNTIKLFNTVNILGKDILVGVNNKDTHQIKYFSNFIQIDIPQKYFTSSNLYNNFNYYVPIKLLDLLIEVFENNTSEDRQILTGKYFIFEENKLTIKEVTKLKLINRSELDLTLIYNYQSAINKLHLKTSLLDDIRYIVFNSDYVQNQLNDFLYLNIERLDYTEKDIIEKIAEEIYVNKINPEIKNSFREKNKLIYDPQREEWKSQNNLEYEGNLFIFESEIISKFIINYIANSDDNLNINSEDIFTYLIGNVRTPLNDYIDNMIIEKKFSEQDIENISFSIELNTNHSEETVNLNLIDGGNRFTQVILTNIDNDNISKFEGSLNFSKNTSTKYLDIIGLIYKKEENFNELNLDLDFLIPLSMKESDAIAPELITESFEIKMVDNNLDLSFGIIENDTMADDINCYISILGPNNNQLELFSIGVDNDMNSYNSFNKKIQIRKNLSKYLPSGIYKISLIELIDATGNIKSYPIDLLFEDEEKYYFEIDNINQDISPPIIDKTSIKISYEKMSLETENIIPILKIQCEDEESGINLLAYNDTKDPNIIYYAEAYKNEIIDDKEYNYFYLFDMKLIENGSIITISNITDNVNNATSINFDIMIDKKQTVLPNNTDLMLELNIIEGYLGLSFRTSDLLYKIERSSNLIKWETITHIKGNNDTYYYLTDDKLTDDSKYYRVKSID